MSTLITVTDSGLTRIQRIYPSGRVRTIGLREPGKLYAPGAKFEDGERVMLSEGIMELVGDILIKH